MERLHRNTVVNMRRLTDFQAHQMEHQLDAYTDCNHGQGLAVIYPAYYRHIVKDAPAKFIRFAKEVFGAETAEAGIDALSELIRECGLRMPAVYGKGWHGAAAERSTGL